jgi:hypothetical protein
MPPYTTPTTITLNAKQVQKATTHEAETRNGGAEPAAAPPAP